MDAELDKAELSAFERFLYWFLVPTVFLLVLLLVLFTLFGYDTKKNAMEFARSIPVVGGLLPDAKSKSPADAEKGDSTAAQTAPKASGAEITTLKGKINDQEDQLKKSDAAFLQKDQALKDLQAKNTQLEEQLKAKTEEPYKNQVQQTSAMYAKMNPSKAAPIIENLTLAEQVLILSGMKQDDQVRVLEKMDPKKAADASIYLKDQVPSKDREIAALQERIKLNQQIAAKGQKLTTNDIGQTFAAMTPKSAATVLVDMYQVNSTKVIDILNATDTQSRSRILTEIASIKKETAAAITNKLTP